MHARRTPLVLAACVAGHVVLAGACSAATALADGANGVGPADSLRSSPVPPEALRFAARIGRDDLMRVSGDFHRFQGRAQSAGPGGLERLVIDRHAPMDWRPQQLPERVPWSAIDEVRMLRGDPGRGALVGAAVCGGVLALLAASAASAYADPTSMSAGEAALRGGAVGALIGAVAGAGLGTAIRSWKVVYHRP